MRSRLALIGVTAALALALPAPAGAVIVPQKSVAGIELQMTESEVAKAAGQPRSKRRRRDAFGRYTEWRYPGMEVVFRTGERRRLVALHVRVTGSAEKTRSGVGVGSTEAEVRRGVRRVKCETIAGARSCHVGSFEPGRTVTDFVIENGAVKFVSFGIVID